MPQINDTYFTDPSVAKECYDEFINYLAEEGIDINEHILVEPSAGSGSFYNLLPDDNRLGLDLTPRCAGVRQADFLEWQPKTDAPLLFIGNPPFGKNATIAIDFIKHIAALNCDYIGMILPMAFDGELVPKKIHKLGFASVYTRKLDPDIFIAPDGKRLEVHTCFQVLARGADMLTPPTCDDWVSLYSIERSDNRTTGINRFNQEGFDIAIGSYFDSNSPELYDKYDGESHMFAQAVIVKRDKDNILNLLRGTDWVKYSTQKTHHARSVCQRHVRQAITDAGYVDEILC